MIKRIFIYIAIACMCMACTHTGASKITVDLVVTDYAYLKGWWPPMAWRSTGLYANPGETITVSLPDGVEGLYIQIGCHTDTLETIPEAERLREGNVVTRQLLEPGVNELTNPHGGLIYFEPTVPQAISHLDIEVTNAQEVPYFVLGKTDPATWKQALTKTDTPYVELESEGVILTVPTAKAKLVDDPVVLMTTWDTFVHNMHDLAGLSPEGALPHRAPRDKWRYVADVQISYGYMYCGYPIMLYDEVCIDDLLSVEGLTKRGWGFWHELGHNLQQNNWEMESMVEVTCNIFSLYTAEKFGAEDRLSFDNDGTGNSSREDAMTYYNSLRRDKNYHDATQTTFFTRLVMFEQLKEMYGWTFYQDLFKSFREIPVDEEPITEQERVDALVKHASVIAKENLTSFFEKWGLKVSNKVKLQLRDMAL